MLFQAFKIKSKLLNSRNNCFSDKSLFAICDSSKNSLEDLTIRNGHRLSDSGLGFSISILKNLRRLDLSFCRQITDACLLQIFSSDSICSTLTTLNVRFLNNITLRGLKPALVRTKALRRLEMSACLQVELTPALYLMTVRKQPIVSLSI